ncbi:site-specific integrase [Gemmatimonadota bacterium]
MARAGIHESDLCEYVVEQFVRERQRQGYRLQGYAGVIGIFLEHLQGQGLIVAPESIPDRSELGLLKSRYGQYLKKERGLTETTVSRYQGIIDRFLAERFDGKLLQLEVLTPSDITDFVRSRAHSVSPSGASLIVTALRSFLRFLFQRGDIPTNLAACVPSVARWRQDSVPRYLNTEQVNRLLKACDRHTSTGRRDYAILLLLARLGFRAGEVVNLELEDIDWRNGEITVPGKGLVRDRLPLPVDVGEAVATYLSRDRCKCPTRRVFLCMKAPSRGFASAGAVSTLVRRAILRAGLDPPLKGAHILRHSLATGMLRSGASMAEIGEILRHRTPASGIPPEKWTRG